MTAPDSIEIRRLRVSTSIGVPDDEQARPQDVWLTVTMVPGQGFTGLADQIRNTVDYHQVALELEALASAKPRRLIETLAVEAAEHLLSHHSLAKVSVTVEKRILPHTECVAVHVQRSRQS